MVGDVCAYLVFNRKHVLLQVILLYRELFQKGHISTMAQTIRNCHWVQTGSQWILSFRISFAGRFGKPRMILNKTAGI